MSGSARAHGPASSEVPFEDACRFIIKVGTAAHNYGATATRLESFLAGLATNDESISGVDHSPGYLRTAAKMLAGK
jgi:hypothetical protein